MYNFLEFLRSLFCRKIPQRDFSCPCRLFPPFRLVSRVKVIAYQPRQRIAVLVHWHAVAVYRFNLGHIVGDDQRSAGCRIKNPVADKTESFHSLARIVEDDFG